MLGGYHGVRSESHRVGEKGHSPEVLIQLVAKDLAEAVGLEVGVSAAHFAMLCGGRGCPGDGV